MECTCKANNLNIMVSKWETFAFIKCRRVSCHMGCFEHCATTTPFQLWYWIHYSVRPIQSKVSQIQQTIFKLNIRNEFQILIYLILLNSGICSPPVVRNFNTFQESRLPSIGNRSESVDEPISAATFDRRGHYIIVGSTKVSEIKYIIRLNILNFRDK